MVAVLLAPAHPAAGQTPVAGVLSGPDALAPKGTGVFTLNATGGPAPEANGNFSITYYVTGPDPAGAKPDSSQKGTATSDARGHFEFNITAPQTEQVITLVVQINSTQGARTERTNITRAITVVTPIVLSATFRNDGGAAALNVSVKFFVDGKVAGTTKLARIDPRSTATATFTYLPVGLGPGTHAVRAEADLNHNGVIEADKGEVAVLDLFYKKDFELTWPWAGLIIVIAITMSALVIRALRRRR